MIAEAATSIDIPPAARGPGIIGPVALVLALASTLTTFLVLAGLTPIEPVHQVVVTTLCINVGFAVLLLAIIVWELRTIRIARRKGYAGAQLHGRIVALFSVIAAAPAILLAAVAAITIDRGLDEWFSTRARAIVDNSLIVARAYIEEQARSIRGEILAMATDINRARPIFDADRSRFREIMTAQATIRGLPGAFLLRGNMSVVERVELDNSRAFPMPPPRSVSEADAEEPVIISPGNQNIIGAVLKLAAYDDLWLFVARPVDPRTNQYLRLTEQAAAEYSVLAQRRFGVQVGFGLMYLVVALTLLLAAIWLGLAFANRLVEPIRRLITAADQVAAGNLYVQVPSGKGQGDLGGLSETFNKMTAQLRTQRNALLAANEQIDHRRRFTQAVLGGVSAGVLGLDNEARINLMNRAGEELLEIQEKMAIGRALEEVAPELTDLLDEARQNGLRMGQRTVVLNRSGVERTLNARLTWESFTASEHGYVITLDDITDLVAAQRTSAWADVARRIAHEIKNPLTPIQLSAERIRRKYGKVIVEDREVFDQCTNTIVRQVDDIKRMVDEFSSFARMPKPVFEVDDVLETVRQVVLMMRVGNPDIEIDVKAPDAPLSTRFDRRLMSQAVTNIVKNAAESIQAVPEEERGQGRIVVDVRVDDEIIVIDVIDNGLGLPVENRNRLLEPYMTTRAKGTGLGLAIVTKILEDHGGRIALMDAPAVADGGRGAMVRLAFPMNAGGGDADV